MHSVGPADRPASPGAAPAVTGSRRWWMLAVALAGAFMILLDATIVNVAIPSIQTGLHASYESIEWMVSGYALAFGLVLIPAGRLGDRFGRRRLFLVSLAGFVAASLLCGISTSSPELVAWRVVQGAMAGALNPQIMAVIQVTFTAKERGKAFGFYGAIAGISTALGPLLGGVLVTADLHGLAWRPIFLLNVPVGIAALVAAWFLLSESRGRGGGLDPGGIALVTAVVLLLTYPLVEGRSAGWPTWALAALAATVPLLGLFAFWQRRRIHTGRTPLIDIRLFRYRAFTAGLGLALCYFAGFTSLTFSLSLWLQIGLGRSALAAGLTLLPFAAGSFFGAWASDAAGERLGPRVLQVGTAMVVIGVGATLTAIHLRGPGVSGFLLLPPLLLAGIGSGLTIAPNINAVLARVPVHDAGAAGGVLSAAQRVGTAVGIAVVGIVLFSSLSGGAGSAAATAAPALRDDLAAAGLPVSARAQEVRHFITCFERRASSADPSASVADCPEPGNPAGTPVSPRFARAFRRALAYDFTHAVQVSMIFNMVAVALAFLLVFFFPADPPKPDSRNNRRQAGARVPE